MSPDVEKFIESMTGQITKRFDDLKESLLLLSKTRDLQLEKMDKAIDILFKNDEQLRKTIVDLLTRLIVLEESRKNKSSNKANIFAIIALVISLITVLTRIL